MLSIPVLRQTRKKALSAALAIALLLSLFQLSSPAQAETEDGSGLLDVVVNKPADAAVDLQNAAIHIALPYGTLYQMLNVTTDPGAAATLFRSDGTTAIPFAATGINKGDAKLNQFSSSGTTLYYLVVTDKNDGSRSKTYTVTVETEKDLPPVSSPIGPNDKFLPLNISAGEHAWDVMGASKIGNGSTTGSIEGPGVPSSYSGKPWSESVYDRSGDYPAASTVNEAWLGDNMYVQTIDKDDPDALAKYGIAGVPGEDKLNSDILRFHEFLPFVAPDGTSRDDGDRGAVDSDRQRLEIKSNTSASNIDANSVGGDIMTHHWRLMLPSETLKFQKDVGDKHAGDFIAPRRFWHIFQLKEISGNAAGQPVATLSLVTSDGIGQLEFRNNPDGGYADRIKPLFTIPFEKVVDRWLDFEVTMLTADNGYIYGKLVDLETGEVLFEGGMTGETYRRPEVENPETGRNERGDLPVVSGQQNRSKWGLYRGMYKGEAYEDEFQAATMYLSDIYLIKRDKDSYIFPDGWNPRTQPKDIVAWARPEAVAASTGTDFEELELPSQLDVTLSTGLTQKVDVAWNPEGYDPSRAGEFDIYGELSGAGITNPKNIKPFIKVTLSGSTDKTPPETAAQVVPDPGDGWLNADASVTLTAQDDASGVARTEYALGDSADWQAYAGPIAVTNEGTNLLRFRSVDAAGNVEQEKEVTVLIDKTKPVFELTANGKPLAEGTVLPDDLPVAVQLAASDVLSGIAQGELFLDGERLESGASADLAGKPGSHSLQVVIADKAGNETDVTVRFTVQASPEGIANLIGRYAKAGELKKPLIDQLSANLKQAVTQLGEGNKDQAAKHMQDFLKLLDNDATAGSISEAAKAVLAADANALIEAWTEA